MQSKGLKVTLFGTSESNETPLMLNFPPHKSKQFSKLFVLIRLRPAMTGSFGGAITEEHRGFLKDEQTVS